jgi:hypothetical protein
VLGTENSTWEQLEVMYEKELDGYHHTDIEDGYISVFTAFFRTRIVASDGNQ